MELRPDTSHKENVSPGPATPLRPEQRRLRKSLGVLLGSGHGPWGPRGQAERGAPATTTSPGPCRVQSNLTSPRPRRGLALKDRTDRLINSSFQQQSNLQPPGALPQGASGAFAVQQSNLSMREASWAECASRSSSRPWLEPQESWPPVMPQGSPLPRGPQPRPSFTLTQSQLLATDSPSPGFMPTASYAPVVGHTWPDPRSWCGLGNWTSRLTGEPLTLEDLANPAKNQAWAPSQAAISQLLASVQGLEHEAARLRCLVTQEPPGPLQQEPWTGDGQARLACPQPSQPVLASWDKRKKRPQGLRGAVSFPETPGVQVGLSDSQASHKPALPPETALEVLTGDSPDPEQGVLPACILRRGERPAYSRGRRGDPLLPQEVGSRGARPLSSTFPRAALGVLPPQEAEEKAPREQNKVRSVSLEPKTACRQLLSRCFRAWQHLVRRQRAVAMAVALGRRQLLRRGLQALRWALWLREAQLQVAWGRHTRALLARSFQKWRGLTRQQKQGQPHIQAGPGPPPSGGGHGQDPSGRKPVVDPAQRSSPGSLREEAGARSIPSRFGPRPDGGDGRVQTLQALQQLAVFLLWCHQKERAGQEKGVQREVSWAMLRTQSMGRPPQAWCSPATDAAWAAPLDPQHQRAWLRRCFWAWQQLVKRGAQYRAHLTDRQMGTLRMCLEQWVQMKHLQASEGEKVTQLSLCQQKEEMWSLLPGCSWGKMVLCSSAHGGTTCHGLGRVAQAQGLPQEQGRGSPQEACPPLALRWVLLLWRARLSQRRRANIENHLSHVSWSGRSLLVAGTISVSPPLSPSTFSFSQGMQQRMLRRTLRAWHLRVWGPGTRSDSARPAPGPEPLGRLPGGAASLGRSTPRSSPEKASRAPAHLETLRLRLLWAAGQQQPQAPQSPSAARWHQRALQRRIFLSWSHWAVAQGAQRELAAHWAWDQSCRAVMSLWRRRLKQRREAEQWAQEQGRRQVRDALQHWHSCWQRQQFLHERYQRWVHAHLQGLRRAAFQSWQQAASRRRHRAARPEQLLLQSHFQVWCGSVRHTGMLRAQCRAFQDGLRSRALGAAFGTWREAQVASARAREHCVAQASIACWRSHVQGGWTDRQLRAAQAQQTFAAWQVALGQPCEAHQQAEERAWAQTRVALCWTQWVHESHLHRLSRAHAAQKLSARVLEAWAQLAAQGRVQHITITQFQHSHLLRTHWAQWRTALLRVRLEPPTEAQETSAAHPRAWAGLTHWPRLAGRGRLLVLMDGAAPRVQTRSCRPQGPGPVLPSPTQLHGLGGQRKRTETSWAPSDSAVQLWMQWPGWAHWAQGQPPPGPGGDCISETSALKVKGQVDKRWLGRKYLGRWHLEALLHRFQGSQQARHLAATWQCWVDAQGAEELGRSLLRQWHLRRAWRMWRRQVVRLQVAQRLQRRDQGWVLSQAFEKWHENLAARGPRRSHQQPEAPE